MSFYASDFNKLSSRKVDHIFHLKDNALIDYEYQKDKEVALINKADYINEIFEYIKTKKIDEFEIVIPKNNDFNLEKVLEVISTYLIENDASIGLLSDDPMFFEDSYELLDKYGVMYSLGFNNLFNGPCDDGFIEPDGALDSFKINGIHRGRNSHSEETIGAYIKGSDSDPWTPKSNKKVYKPIKIDKSFSDKLWEFLNLTGKTSVEVYEKGGISKQVFSKLLSDPTNIPKRSTVFSIIIGLELNYEQAIELMACAGYVFSKSFEVDVVVMNHVLDGDYDIGSINDELHDRHLPLLGWWKNQQYQ